MWYFGKGRAAELVDEKAATDFNLLIVDDELAPNQQRSLEKLLDCKVLDRSALIIDIFARHARTPRRAACRSSWPRSSTTCRA